MRGSPTFRSISRASSCCMLEKDPANRFPDAQSVVVALSSGVMPTLRTAQNAAADRRWVSASYGIERADVARRNGFDDPHAARDSADLRVPTPDELDRWNASPSGNSGRSWRRISR